MIYLVGDILTAGNQLLRAAQAKILRELGLNIYSPIEDKEINDKTKQTRETNDNLAERIVLKDTAAIRKCDTIIAEVDNNSIGSICELAQIKEMNWFHEQIVDILRKNKDEDLREKFQDLIKQVPFKTVYCFNDDLRNTNIEEKGNRRSHYYNQYLHGICLEITEGKGIQKFNQILKYFKKEK